MGRSQTQVLSSVIQTASTCWPAGLRCILCSAASPSLPCPQETALAKPMVSSLINKQGVVPCHASHNGRGRGKMQFKFHQSQGGVRRGLIRLKAFLITYSSVSSQAQTSRYSSLSLHSEYKI